MRVVTVARKPCSEGTTTANVAAHATGALNIDRCRVGKEQITQHGRKAKKGTGWDDHWHNELEGGRSWTGRWPANVVLVHRDGCEIVGERRVPTGTAHREHSGGKNIFSETDKKPLPNMTYGDGDGKETIPDWRCELECPARAMGEQSGILKTGDFKQRGQSSNTQQPGGWRTGPREAKDFVGDTGTAARYFKQVTP